MLQSESNKEDLDDNVAEYHAESNETICGSEHSQHNTDTEHVPPFIGLLYMAGLKKSNSPPQ